MAITARHVKARLLRDYYIKEDMMKSFGEHEIEQGILFAGAFTMGDSRKQVIIPIDDTPYTNVQVILSDKIPEGKRTELLELINLFNLQFPLVKYVIAKTDELIASFPFKGDEQTFNPEELMMNIFQICQNIKEHQYDKLQELLGE